MPWKIGGNFEVAAITCETNWQECAVAVLNYLWCETVSDVVDYLAKEGIIWVLAIIIASTILIRIKYRKNVHMENLMLNKQILNKVRYKIHDLELKVNILTYKMQYGTWPLPHQIYSLNPKKLRKIRMSLSNPGDQKNWINHVLLSSVGNSTCTPYSNTFNLSMTKLPKYIDVEQKHALHQIQCNKLSTDSSSIEISKSTSDQSKKICSQTPNIRSQNVSTKGNLSESIINLSESDNFTLQRQNVQLLPFPDEINRSSSRTSLNGKCVMYSTNAKYSACQKFTVYKCKSFLKELKCNNKHLHSLSYSSETSEASLKTARVTKEATLFTTQKRKVPFGARITTKKEEIHGEKCTRIKDNKMMKDTKEIYENTSINAIMSNNSALSKKLVSIYPIIQTTHNAPSSREILYEVRKRLQSLYNVLQTYQHKNQSSGRWESLHKIGKIDTFASVGSKIEEANRNEIDMNHNINLKENLKLTQCSTVGNNEYFEFDRSEESLSSFAGYSFSTSKTYQCPGDIIALRNTYSKGLSQHNTRQRSIETSGFPSPTSITKPYGYKQHSRFHNAMSQTSENNKNKYEENTRKHNPKYDGSNELESYPKINEDKANVLFNPREKLCEAASNKICYILSSESFEVKSTKDQDESLSMKTFVTEKFNDICDTKQHQENMIISQNDNQSKMLNNSDEDEKSTVLLLQEALHFKKALLTHKYTQSRKRYPVNSREHLDIADKSLECETRSVDNNFPSMILDIKMEKPIISDSHNRINQRYVYLEMKQRRDIFPHSLQKVDTFAHSESENDINDQNSVSEKPSKYYSIADLTMYNNDKIVNNVSLPSIPPVYEKVISITIPLNEENQKEIDVNEELMHTKTTLKNIQNHIGSDDLKENLDAADIDSNVTDKHSPMLRLEDLILEQIKNIRDYMDIFLQSQNRVISKTCRELQCQGKSDIFRRSSETSHIVLHNRLIASSNCNNATKIASFSKNSPNILINTWPNYRNKIYVKDDSLECNSDMRLKKNPGVFALITPVKSTVFNEYDAQWLKTTQVRKKDKYLWLPIDPKPINKITDLNTSYCGEYRITPNTGNNKIDEQTTDKNVNFQKHGKQTQVRENKFSAISYFPLNFAKINEKVAQMTREEYVPKCNHNSISNNNSYFTDEIINAAKVDNVSSKSTSNMEPLHAKLNVKQKKIHQSEVKQNAIKEQISIVERLDPVNVIMPSKLTMENAPYSNSMTFIDSNFNFDKLTHNYSTDMRTTLKKNNIAYDTSASLLPSSLDIEEKILNTDDNSLNNLKQKDEIFANVIHLSPRPNHHSTKRLFQTCFRIKAKSDVSLTISRSKDLNIYLYSRRSHLFLRHHTLEHIHRILNQPNAKLHKNNKYIENKLQLTTQSKSIIPQKVSTKSCIPILKNRLEPIHRTKHQSYTKSPTRSPLTVLWKQKICTKSHPMDEEVAERIAKNKHLCVEKTALNLIKLDTEKDIFGKSSNSKKINTAYKDDNITSKKNSRTLSNNRNVKSPATVEEHLNEKYSSRSGTTMEHTENITPKEMTVIPITSDDNLQKNYLINPFILKTENICSATDLLIHKNKLRTVTIEKTEKAVTAKPSVTDTCTSITDLY